MKTRTMLLAVLWVLVCCASPAQAADQWIEVRSANFTVVSNASDRAARSTAWQLEQVRSAMQGLWAWARIDLTRPLCVIAVKDEQSLRQLAPGYWEQRGGLRPASVWVSGVDRHYLTIRTDLRAKDTDTMKPHMTAYFSYVGLIMGQSLDPDLPLWFSRGLAGVLSNTLVRDEFVLVGAPIPWKLELLNERARSNLPAFLSVTRRSPEYTDSGRRQIFDAQAWAFVHFLMFGEGGKRQQALNRFAQLVSAGTEAQAAFAEALGPVDALETPFSNYISRSIFSFAKVALDVSVERERFPVRKLAPAEAAAVRASFHAAMRRPGDARVLIAEAQKAEPAFPESYTVEGLLLDAERKPVEARTAFAKAVELGSTSAYAHYRLAGLMWRPGADRETLVEIEKAPREDRRTESQVCERSLVARRDPGGAWQRRLAGARRARNCDRAARCAASPAGRVRAPSPAEARRGEYSGPHGDDAGRVGRRPFPGTGAVGLDCEGRGWATLTLSGGRAIVVVEAGRGESAMIRGLLITIRGEELKEKITVRIHLHQAKADALDERIRQREGDMPFDIRIEDGLQTFGELMERRDHHRNRSAELRLIRDHLDIEATYALAPDDLRAVDLVSAEKSSDLPVAEDAFTQ